MRNTRKKRVSIYEHTLRTIYPQTKVHVLDASIKKKLTAKFNNIIPHSVRPGKTDKEGLTYFELFRVLSGSDDRKNPPHMVFLKGGMVRDIVEGKSIDEINDVDIIFTRPFKQVKFGKPGLNVANASYVSSKDASRNYYYIKVGVDDAKHTHHQSVDGTNAIFTPDNYSHYESPLNTLFINVTQNRNHPNELDRVYDLTGVGWKHAKQKLWTVPSEKCMVDPDWLKNAKLWRCLKFQLRGYTVPKNVLRHIYAYWMNPHAEIDAFNWDNIWGKVGLNDSKKHSAEVLQHNLVRLFAIVCQNFRQLAYTPHHAAAFCKLLLRHNAFTVISRLNDLRKIRTHHKTLKHSKKPSRLSSRITEDSTQNTEVHFLLNYVEKEGNRTLTTIPYIFNLVLLLVDMHVLTTFHHMSLRYKLLPEMVSVCNVATLKLHTRTPTQPDIWSIHPSHPKDVKDAFKTVEMCCIGTAKGTGNKKPSNVSVLQFCEKVLACSGVKDVFANTPIVEQLLKYESLDFKPDTSEVHFFIQVSSHQTVEKQLKTLCGALNIGMHCLPREGSYLFANRIHCCSIQDAHSVMHCNKLLGMKQFVFYGCANYV